MEVSRWIFRCQFARKILILTLVACFNVVSGDVEDAPAPNALNKFDVFEKDGEVFVRGDENQIASGGRQPITSCSIDGDSKVVIVGG